MYDAYNMLHKNLSPSLSIYNAKNMLQSDWYVLHVLNIDLLYTDWFNTLFDMEKNSKNIAFPLELLSIIISL